MPKARTLALVMLGFFAAPAAAAPPTVTITAPPDLRGVKGNVVVSYTIAPAGDFAELYYDYSTSEPSTFRDANYTSGQTAGSFQINSDALNEGYLTVKVRSAISNEFANSPFVTLVVDRTAPTVGIGLNDTDALRGSVNVPVNVTEAPVNRPDVLIGHVDLQVDGVNAATIPGSALSGGFTLDTGQYPDGNHQVRAVAVDEAGNIANSTTKTVSFDNTPPAVSFAAPTPAENQEVRAGPVTFSFAIADTHFPVTAACRVGTADFGPCSGGASGGNGSHEFSATSPGAYIFEVRVTDALGNQAVTARHFRVDGGAPQTAIVSGPAEGATIPTRNVTFAFAVDDPSATTACRLTGPGGGPDFGPCSGPGLTHSAAGLADGDYVFEVRSTDALGNVEAPVRRGFRIALPAAAGPAIPILSPITNSWIPGRRFTRVALLVARSVPAGAKVEARCSGRGCPFKRRTFKVTNRRAVLTKAFRKARLRPKAVIEIRITAPGRSGKVVRYRMVARRIPRSTVLCLPPGAVKPAACE